MNFLSKLPTPGRNVLHSSKTRINNHSQNFVKPTFNFPNSLKLNAQQARSFSKSPVVRNEGAPIVVNLEPEEK
jgi:hypothetical protein